MDNGALADEAGTKSNDFTGDYLDADTEYGATNSVRVFPDGRLVGGVVGTSRNTVRIKVEVKPNFAIATKVYLRAFDMDDPSQNKKDVGIVNRPEGGRLILDPNDDGIAGTYDGGTGLTYDMHNDNRGLVKGRKFGSTFPDSSKMDVMGKFTISFPVGANVNNPDTTKFQVSEFAGDNYVLFAASDKAHLLHLENKDELDSDTIKDVSSGRKLPIDKGVKSNILTVWRLLHLEYDSMRNFAWGNNNNGNYETSGVISSLVNAGAGAAIGNSQEALSGDIGFSNIGLMPYDIDPSLFYSNLGQA
jgi:hypothetical protein